MSPTALVIVIVAAVIHATWNLLAKKSGGGSLFVWLFTTLSSLILVPVALVLVIVQQSEITIVKSIFIAGTALLHLVYFLLLQRGYQAGDLSLVYPIARGLGPALATVGAVLLLGERPTLLAIAGLVLIVVGMLVLTWRRKSKEPRHSGFAVFYGVLTGVSIAVYSVWDKVAVARLDVSPIVLEAFTGLGISFMLTPSAIRRWGAVKAIWREHKVEAIGVAVLAPLSYILILTAMSFTPLSYVAPCREISILFAALLGAKLLGEGNAGRRVAGACFMVAGVVALAMG